MLEVIGKQRIKPLKILHIGKYFPPYAGGMETYLRDLMAAQIRQGLEPGALVHQSQISLNSASETYQSGEQQLPVTRAAVWARLLFTPISPTFPRLLSKMIKRDKPDLLHLHMPNVSAFCALFLPSARKIPWVIHWHADVLASTHSSGLRTFYRLYRPFESALLKRSAKIIATSPPYLDSSEPLRPFKDKCEVVPLGLDPSKLVNALAASDHRESDTLRVLAIGRLTYYKGFEYLIRAIAQSEGIELHLVGTGELDNTLRKLAAELDASSKITFYGKLPDDALAAQFHACDCLCLPSIERTEAFGMVLLEAMSLGKAAIVTKIPGAGMKWVVKHGNTGLHVNPESTAELTQSLHNFRDNRDIMHLFGKFAQQRFETDFHIETSAKNIADMYRRLMNTDTVDQPIS
ncbi:glycosyl transferase, group 1 family [marine gamma proteobacterium HTCC2148]|nr:glycosyl transferase, group 1 family [marine gamma proteobacterium HTCC2148]